MSWVDIGIDSRKSAQLLRENHPRSCVSRAYYAAFSVINERLFAHASPPPKYETHAHAKLPDLIEKHLFRKNSKLRNSLRTAIKRLYNARLVADYRSSRTVDRSVALGALRDAKAIFAMIGVNDA